MIPQQKTHTIKVLKTALKYIEDRKNSIKLKDLSNETIHSASIFKDQDAIVIAILIYAMYKLLATDGKITTEKIDKMKVELSNMISSLTKSDYTTYNNSVKNLTMIIKKTDDKYSSNIGELLMKARIVKGALLFKHGLSLSFVASLLNISKWELISYVGKTKYTEVNEDIDVLARVGYLDEALK